MGATHSPAAIRAQLAALDGLPKIDSEGAEYPRAVAAQLRSIERQKDALRRELEKSEAPTLEVTASQSATLASFREELVEEARDLHEAHKLLDDTAEFDSVVALAKWKAYLAKVKSATTVKARGQQVGSSELRFRQFATGDYSSIVCFKALILGVEDTLSPEGAAAVYLQAGRLRGKNLVDGLGLAGTSPPPDQLAGVLNNALGTSGTRLCRIDTARQEGDDLILDISETVELPTVLDEKRVQTFTLGAIWGALETIYGTQMHAKPGDGSYRFSRIRPKGDQA